MLSGYGYVYHLHYNSIGHHGSDVYVETSTTQDGGSYLILACVGKNGKTGVKRTIQDNGDKLISR